MADNRYCVDYAKRGQAGCKKCKQKLEKGCLRLGKVVANPFSDAGSDMKQWFHPKCMFETFARARATTKKIEEPEDDLEGWPDVTQDDKKIIIGLINDMKASSTSSKKTPTKTPAKRKTNSETEQPQGKSPRIPTDVSNKKVPKLVEDVEVKVPDVTDDPAEQQNNKCHAFREFRRLCANIAEQSSYNVKSEIVSKFFSAKRSENGGGGFQGNLYLWAKMLLPKFVKRVYNLQSKQLINLLSRIFATDADDMLTHLEQGDVADTAMVFFEKSQTCCPVKKSTLTLQEVDRMLEELSDVTKEDDQIRVLTKIAKRCTGNDLKMIIRLIKHDLRINAGAKHILEGIHPSAYEAFQASRDLKDVIDRIEKQNGCDGKPGMSKNLSVRASLMTPIIPMLAEACKSMEQAFKKCPNGIFAEIKYDGERVQVHKQGDTFTYFSRSLKPVLPHKVSHFKDYIPQAFPSGEDLILDSEVLLIDTNTGKPLPFGTLGKHKKEAFQDANVCLFVFDCIHYNGENMMSWPLRKRRDVLKKHMVEVPNRIMFSEIKILSKMEELREMAMDTFRKGLEGLVLKDAMSTYEPGKRHWLKLKKDYLADGAMADSADLVVLGAFYGTGHKGGMMSIFLMGCLDEATGKWCTVTKVSGGHDDKTLERLQKELDMMKISKDASKVPGWLVVNKNLVPDLVICDPKKSQVWEITGAEFTKAEIHTAAGISIRFPRVTRIRDDKTWKEHTNLAQLKDLFDKSKEFSTIEDFPRSGAEKEADREKYELVTSPKAGTSKSPKQSPKPPKRKLAANDDDDNDITHAKKSKPEIGKQKPRRITYKMTNPLPDVFDGVKLYVPSTVPKYDLLMRHVVGYGGEIVDEWQLSDSTHVVIGADGKVPQYTPPSAKLVTVQWAWQSIKKLSLQPIKLFQPKIE